MADVVNQGQSLSQIRVQPQSRSNRTCNLRDLYGVGKPVPEVVRASIGKDLGFILQAPKRAGVDYAVAIALKIRSVGVGSLMMPSSARFVREQRVGGVHVSESSAQQFSAIGFRLSLTPIQMRFYERSADSAHKKARRENAGLGPIALAEAAYGLLLGALLFGQLYLRALQLLLHPGYIVAFDVGGVRTVPLFESARPLG